MMRKMIFLLFILTALANSHALAVSTKNGIALTEKGKIRHWKTFPISLCLDAQIPGQHVPEIKAAIDVWNISLRKSIGKDIFKADCEDKSGANEYEFSSRHSIYWVTNNFKKFAPKTILARTLTAYNEDTGEYTDANIVLNAEFFSWESSQGSHLDLQSVMTHELGHVLGLQHLEISQDTALKSYPYQSGIIFRKLGNYEEKAVSNFYQKDKKTFMLSYLDDAIMGNTGDAIAQLEKSKLKNEISEEDRLFQLGSLYRNSGNNEKAELYFKKVVSRNEKNVLALYQLGDLYWLNKNEKSAKQYFQKIIEINPNYYEAIINLAVIKYNEGNKKEAQLLFEKTIEINPTHYIACDFLLELTGNKKYKACGSDYADK